MKQSPPFAIQIELTEGCNLFCKFCGVKGIRKGPGEYRFLNLTKAAILALKIKESGWNSRIEFAMHGEPTLNPNFQKIIEIFREKLDNQLMMTTNGTGLTKFSKTKIQNLMNYLTVLAIDDYDHNPFSKKIKKQIQNSSLDIHEYPKEKEYSPHAIYKKSNPIVFIQDISKATKGTHSILNNHCGNASPKLKYPMKQRCAKPFRELSIRYDGNVAICCNDWVGLYKCGNIFNESAEQLWNNIFFNAARKMLYNSNRNFIPCKWCNAKSYRVGFLPDKMGKKTLPKPTRVTCEIASKASLGNPYIKPIKKDDKDGILSFT